MRRKLFPAALILLCAMMRPTMLLSQASEAMQHPGAVSGTVDCPRYKAGDTVSEPKNLFSRNGVLRVALSYRTRTTADGSVLFCFMSPDGTQSPTLHVRPGDELTISLKNDLPASMQPSFKHRDMPGMTMSTMPEMAIGGAANPDCGGMMMTASSTNMHFHGTNVPPVCHQDEVIKTLINAGETFEYDVHFPYDEPPGLYWYHPHIHGISEAAVQGGASGALIVDGLENMNHEVAGMPQRTLIVRDKLAAPYAGDGDPDSDPPAWELSLNYVPVASPTYTPAVIPMRPRQKQLWRVLNASADTILDLQVQYDGVAQPMGVVAIDGVPTGSEDGATEGRTLMRKHFLLAPASRVEFLLTGPTKSVKKATLLTLNVDTGPIGDNDPQRPLAMIKPGAGAADPPWSMPAVSEGPAAAMRFQGLSRERPVRHRKLYFSEILSDPTNPDSPTNFYITVDGATPTLFDPGNPPAIVTTQGAVEDWTIENRAGENHEFHIHQIHFLVLDRDGNPVSGQYRDTVNIPYWTGTGPYPSVTLRMDFRGPTVGDFVYHCHILGHEDSGMMAIIRVLPRR